MKKFGKYLLSQYRIVSCNNAELYYGIVEHRKNITPIRGIDYANHVPHKINPIPPDKIFNAWKRDYETMQENMIYKESLQFDKLIERIKELKVRINNLT